MNPGCRANEAVGFSTDVSCSETSLSILAFNDSLSCKGDSLTEFTIDSDVCWQLNSSAPIPEFLEDYPIWDKLEEILDTGIIQLDRSDFFYYVDCGGADNLPGVDTSSASSSNDDDDESYGGLGVVGLSLVIVFSVLVGALCCACLAKRFLFSGKGSGDQLMEGILDVGEA